MCRCTVNPVQTFHVPQSPDIFSPCWHVDTEVLTRVLVIDPSGASGEGRNQQPGLARTSSVICPCPLGCARESPGAQPTTLFYRDLVESFTAWWELSLFPVAMMKYSKVLETAGPVITVRRAAPQLPFSIVHSRASPQRMV